MKRFGSPKLNLDHRAARQEIANDDDATLPSGGSGIVGGRSGSLHLPLAAAAVAPCRVGTLLLDPGPAW